MVTGRRAFEGKSQASLIAAIMNGRAAADLGAPAADAARARPARQGCLAKDPEERWQSAHDVCSSCGGSRSAATRQPRRRAEDWVGFGWCSRAALWLSRSPAWSGSCWAERPACEPRHTRSPTWSLHPRDRPLRIADLVAGRQARRLRLEPARRSGDLRSGLRGPPHRRAGAPATGT